jgi:hypothetical protein
MQPDLLENLLSRREEVLTSKRALEQELDELNALITRYQSGSSKEELRTRSPLRELNEPKQPRVRGVLAAARKAIEQLPGPFDKNQLLTKLREDEEFADKKITAANVRNALRMLTQQKMIKVKRNATATSCATYIRVTLNEANHQQSPSLGSERRQARAGRQ